MSLERDGEWGSLPIGAGEKGRSLGGQMLYLRGGKVERQYLLDLQIFEVGNVKSKVEVL